MAKASNTESGPRKKMLRALLIAPVAVGVLAGAVVAGTGVGAAAPAESPSQGAIAWSVTNLTDQTLTVGRFYRQEFDQFGESTAQASRIEFGGPSYAPALKPGDQATTDRHVPGKGITKTWGDVCYQNTKWEISKKQAVDTPGVQISVGTKNGQPEIWAEGGQDEHGTMYKVGTC